MSAVEPLTTTTPAAPRRKPRRHLRPVAPTPTEPGVDLAGLSSQLSQLERDLRHTWNVMLELDAATAGRVSHAGKLLHQASIVLGDHTAIY